MKKYLTYFLASAILLGSCKKEDTTTPVQTQKEYNIALNVTGLSVSTAPFKSGAKRAGVRALGVSDTLQNHITQLYYLVMDSAGNIIRNINQPSSDASFGAINIQLPPGKFTVIAAGGQDNFKYDVTYAFCYLRPNVDNKTPLSFQDTFYKSIVLTVTNSDISSNISLDRVVSQLEVNIQDAIPANAKSIKVAVSYDCYSLGLDGTTESGNFVNGISFGSLTTGATNTKGYAYMLNTLNPTSVDIKCLDASGSILVEKTISNVSFQRNKTTLLTGNLFSLSGDGGVNIGYDPSWSTTTLNYPL